MAPLSVIVLPASAVQIFGTHLRKHVAALRPHPTPLRPTLRANRGSVPPDPVSPTLTSGSASVVSLDVTTMSQLITISVSPPTAGQFTAAMMGFLPRRIRVHCV